MSPRCSLSPRLSSSRTGSPPVLRRSLARRRQRQHSRFSPRVVARAATAWGFEVAGRRAATDVLSRLRLDLVGRRLRDRPAALDGVESAEVATVAVGGLDALEASYARYLPQLVLAFVVPIAVLASSPDRPRCRRRVMLADPAAEPVFFWLVGRDKRRGARALAGDFPACNALPRRRPGLPRSAPSTAARPRSSGSSCVSDEYRPATMGTLRLAFLSGSRARAGRDTRGRPRRRHGRCPPRRAAAIAFEPG